MNALQRTLGFSSALAFGCWLIAGCNSLIGADKPNHVASLGACVLASDCPAAQICVFSQCSKQCAADKDCQFGRCLQTSDGNACVIPASAACKTDDDCPAGSQCTAKACRSTCRSNAECLSDQTCINAACVGTDNLHDPTGGSGGGGGGGDMGGTGGTTPTGDSGAAGAAGEPGGGMSSGGTAGGGGVAGMGGMSDGTAVGSLSAACDKEGALACAGHAQRSQLICQGGIWKTNGTCDGSSFCDSTPGANAGACQPILAECAGKMAGDHVCRAAETDLRGCGVDLVTANVIMSCPFACSNGACSGDCHSGDKGCKAGNLIPQICQDNGTWQDQTKCGYQCDPATAKCIAAGCKDNVKNGDETDKDCGGSCGGCPVDGACQTNSDCVSPASAHCLSLKCVAAACTDGIKNGDETGPDCGGSCPADCAVGVGCNSNGDCALPASGHCSSNVCVAAACNDGVPNGTETALDCGGSCAADCAVGANCGVDGDCASGVCLTGKCVACRPTTKQCAVSGAAFQVCSTTGVWGTSQACSTVNGTPSCVNGACSMMCSPGYGDCNAASVNDGCEKLVNSVTSCGTCTGTVTCTAPGQKCSSGSCVTNPQYDVGNSSDVGFSAYDPPNDSWHLVQITAPQTCTVTGFRLLGRTGGSGQALMALWADDGAGRPGAYLAQSAKNSMPVAMGLDVDQPTPLGVQLTAGKKYWVGAVFTANAHISYKTVSGSTVYKYPLTFGTSPAVSLSTFPAASASTLSDMALNLFLLVQDVPQ